MPKGRKTKTASLMHERQYYAQGIRHIVGMDEVGRGTWAGPVTVGAVCLPIADAKLSTVLRGVRDSKVMTPKQRTLLSERIKETAVAWGIGSATSGDVDELGIVPATKLAMQRALQDLAKRTPKFVPDCLFLDSLLWPEMKKIPQVSIVDGDARSLSIAAASVIAKVWRDNLMVELAKEFPNYDFEQHKGYGTAKHQAALKAYGPSPLHRMSFAPVRSLNE